MNRNVFGVLVFALLASSCSSGGASSASDSSKSLDTVRVATVGGLTDAGLIVAEELGYFEEAGIDYRHQRMPGTDQIGQLTSGNIDVAAISTGAGLLNAAAGGLGIKVVLDKSTVPDNGTLSLVARADVPGGDLKTVLTNLNGKTVGYTGKDVVPGPAWHDLVVSQGLEPSRITVKELKYPELVAGLTSGAIDAAVLIEPFVTQAVALGETRVVTDFSEIFNTDTTIVPLEFSEDFATSRRDVAQRFATAYIRGVRTYNDALVYGAAKDREQVIRALADAMEISASDLSKYDPPALNPDGAPSMKYLSRQQDLYVEWGLVKKHIDVASIVDTSFAEAAVRELGGPYVPPGS